MSNVPTVLGITNTFQKSGAARALAELESESDGEPGWDR